MKTQEAIEQMSTQYLERIVRSFMKEDIPKKEEEEQRKEIRNNINTLADPSSMQKRLVEVPGDMSDLYSERILASLILQSLLSFDNLRADEGTLIETVQQEEQEIIEAASQKNAFGHIERSSLDIFREVLKVALEDEQITRDEENLLRKLRKKLGINETDQYLVQSSLELFPKKGNAVHTPKEVQKGLAHLQKCGIVFYCNKPKEKEQDPFFVLPEEISKGVKEMLGIELVESKYRLLLQHFQSGKLAEILDERKLMVSGKKDQRIERIIRAGIDPSEALDELDSGEIYELCGKLPGMKKSGKKAQKIQEIIDHFDALVNKEKGEGEDPRATYYKFFEQLAARDYSNLRGQDVIQKDVDIQAAFEEATRYLFTEKLGLEVEQMDGKKNPDGKVRNPKKNKEVLLWDNKSQEKPYDFPDSHKDQFRRYITDAHNDGEKVMSFLVITQQVKENAEKNAQILKAEADSTDVALIAAEDLKYLAENWQKFSKKKQFDPNVLNATGILDRQRLEQLMEWFLG